MTARKHSLSISRLVRTHSTADRFVLPGQLENSLTTQRVVVSAVANGTFPWDSRGLTRRARIPRWRGKKSGAEEEEAVRGRRLYVKRIRQRNALSR